MNRIQEWWYRGRVWRFFGPTALIYKGTTFVAFQSGAILRIVIPMPNESPARAWQWIWRHRYGFMRPLFANADRMR